MLPKQAVDTKINEESSYEVTEVEAISFRLHPRRSQFASDMATEGSYEAHRFRPSTLRLDTSGLALYGWAG